MNDRSAQIVFLCVVGAILTVAVALAVNAGRTLGLW